MSVKCSRLKADGSPCLAPAMKNADFCFFHASNDDVKAAVKKQDEALDLATELKHELRRVQSAKGNSLEKAKLALEIMKFLRELEGGKPSPEAGESKPTPREILLGKK